MITFNKMRQFGKEGLDVKGITIHNSGSFSSAREIFDWLNNECKTSQGCHYLVDSKEIIQVMPLNWSVYQTGKGEDFAFKNTISIEICESHCPIEVYLKAQNNAVVLIKKLMNRYELTDDDIYFHIDFNSVTYCPHRILDLYKSKYQFIKEVLHANSDVK